MKITLKQKQIIKRFNEPETHLVISRWPKIGASYDGVATYTQDIVTQFAKKYGDRFVILAEKVDDQVIEQINDRVLVIRAFDERRFHLYPQVLTWLRLLSRVKKVYVHSEFCASGGPILRFLTVPFIGLIRLFGKDITFYAHNVVRSLDGFKGHLGEDGWKLKVLGFGYRWYFQLLSILVSRFVVLELSVAENLRALVGNKPILVEPHWVSPVKTIDKNQARKKLGIPISRRLIVSFGFVSYYKGSDFMTGFARWLLKHKKNLEEDLQVVLAGGMAYSLKSKKYYLKYYDRINRLSEELPNLTLTGFLSEKEVSLWLSAADLVVFPYRNFMGGSGALQQALRYDKPILFSSRMARGLKIASRDPIFNLNYLSLYRKINSYFNNSSYRKSLCAFTGDLAFGLNINKLLPKHYLEVYDFPPERNTFSLIQLLQKLNYALATNKS